MGFRLKFDLEDVKKHHEHILNMLYKYERTYLLLKVHDTISASACKMHDSKFHLQQSCSHTTTAHLLLITENAKTFWT